MPRYAKAKAHANIALAKYWGKSDKELNLPAVPSLSLTLDAFWTETSVHFDPKLSQDSCLLNGEPARDRELARIQDLLDRVRTQMKEPCFAHIKSKNNFPTASGLASSASGFAALAAATSKAAGLPCDFETLSALARQSSASAARSIYGAFVELAVGIPGDYQLAAQPLQNQKPWKICMLVASLGYERKALSSTEAMQHSKHSSPYYSAWIENAPLYYQRVREGVLKNDLQQVGEAMEQSTFAMHACMLASIPRVLFWKPATVAVLDALRALREQAQVPAWCTMDAGPHVKILCEPQHSETVANHLHAIPGVETIFHCGPGPALSFLEES
ncbi:MAG: diphosphomevalonate decarboxylase [Myxococcales bacterium]|nr:MAG: diphosphomevalonate decarboxylase [Myxococcales bacterium]